MKQGKRKSAPTRIGSWGKRPIGICAVAAMCAAGGMAAAPSALAATVDIDTVMAANAPINEA
ncbi:hypothetical protein [Rarobacter incanus]|uniref:Uncharacterized protein n=1 Tax=Rarobacter incanus TaxID=153494 RepID=A0A542SQQ6_9MICO|nr:hypothetical protein [Rarobacter incanus]TQK76934.1 hypothetical protein FB389_1637 [Rarobacter incanus]